MSALGDKDIRRLDVAVNNALAVSGVETFGDFCRQFQQLSVGSWLSTNAIPQRRAFQQLHHDEELAILLRQFREWCRCWDD